MNNQFNENYQNQEVPYLENINQGLNPILNQGLNQGLNLPISMPVPILAPPQNTNIPPKSQESKKIFFKFI